MTEDLFNLILKTATYNGEVCYNNAEEMEGDYKVNKCVSLDPTEIKRLVFTAYEFGRNKATPTFNQNISALCTDAELRIRELEEGYRTIKKRLLNQKYDYATRIDDALDFIDEQLGE